MCDIQAFDVHEPRNSVLRYVLEVEGGGGRLCNVKTIFLDVC